MEAKALEAELFEQSVQMSTGQTKAPLNRFL